MSFVHAKTAGQHQTPAAPTRASGDAEKRADAMTHRILLVEDEPNYRELFALLVADFDVDVELLEAADGLAALEVLERTDVELVVTDLTMPRMDGMQLLQELRGRRGSPPVVVITAYGSVESAVEAMRAGAIDYLQKPFDEQRLDLTLRRALRVTDLLAENRRLRDAVESTYDFSRILGESPAMVGALQRAGKVAGSDAAVLLQGESGTGKELVAQAIHYNSARASGPFVAVNCAAVPETLLEAELFGVEPGAYTGAAQRRRGLVEAARGGTLFFDEIGDMPLALQAKLLRLLQERAFRPLGSDTERQADVRFLFATNRSLEAMVASGDFREDLYYRVSVLPVSLPPLRDRGDDVLLLAEAFIARTCRQMGCRPLSLSPTARAALRRHRFPGNVRELANLVERGVILAEDDLVELDLAVDAGPGQGAPAAPAGASRLVLPDEGLSLEQVERDLVVQALQRTGGNKTRAARLLGLTRGTLRYRIEKLGLDQRADGD
jgi:DNA-binding NtrC family response regulator